MLQTADDINITLVINWHVISLNLGIVKLWENMDFCLLLKLQQKRSLPWALLTLNSLGKRIISPPSEILNQLSPGYKTLLECDTIYDSSKNTKIVTKVMLLFWWHHISRWPLKLSIFMNKSNSSCIITYVCNNHAYWKGAFRKVSIIFVYTFRTQMPLIGTRIY